MLKAFPVTSREYSMGWYLFNIIGIGLRHLMFNKKKLNNRTMNKKLINGCLVLIIAFAALAFAYIIWTFAVMA